MNRYDKVALQGELFKAYADYWRTYLSEMPFTMQSPNQKKVEATPVTSAINVRVPDFGSGTPTDDAKLMSALTAILALTLYRYRYNEAVVIETPMARLDDASAECFQLIPISFSPEGCSTFRDLLNRAHRCLKDCYAHQSYPLSALGYGQGNFSDVMLVYSNLHSQPAELARHPIVVRATRSDETLSVDITCDLYRINPDFAETLSRAFIDEIRIIHGRILNDPLATMPDLAETEKLLRKFNDTRFDFEHYVSIQSLFEKRVSETPDAVALVYGTNSFTYAQLNVLANNLGNHLRVTYDVGPDYIVGLMDEVTPWFTIGMLGILKAGGAYLPIDPSYPGNRISHILKDSGIKLLLTTSDYLFSIQEFNGQIYALDIETEQLPNTKTNLTTLTVDTALAYVIYTSGSTGVPKGIAVEHRGLINMCLAQIKDFNVTAEDNVMQFASPSFDACVSEIFMALGSGATLVLKNEQVLDTHSFLEFGKSFRITVVTLPPSYLKALGKNDLSFLRLIISAGEAAKEELLWHAKKSTVCNAYGPAEGTVCSTIYTLNSTTGNEIPIGYPIANTRLYILSRDLLLLPHDVPGEIVIGGISLARGYLNNPELTHSRFIPDLFVQGSRMYRTGDLGKWKSDGCVDYMGRVDFQVKIRGFRIETGEVEHCITLYPTVKAAVVLKKGDNENACLVAFIQVSGNSFEEGALRKHLAEYLPSYMIPAEYIVLEEFPVNPNGKLDRRRMLEMADTKMESVRQVVAPSGPTQELLVKVWKEILEKESISTEDNFFEVGGHSLRVIKLITRLQQLAGRTIGMNGVFNNPVLKDLATHFDTIKEGNHIAIVPIEEQSYYQLSSAQRRLWILSQFGEGNIAYTIPGYYRFNGLLDRDALLKTFQTLIARHESLRTTFVQVEGVAMQKVHDPFNWNYTGKYTDFDGVPGQEEAVSSMISDEMKEPFNLEQGPLLRWHLIRLSEHDHIFIFTMHHIISDGWSMEVLVREVMQLYTGFVNSTSINLAPLPVQYKDYTAWQSLQLNENSSVEHRKFWLHQLQGELPVLDFPSDKRRPLVKTFSGSSIDCMLDIDLSNKLKETSLVSKTTLFMTLLAAVKVVLFRYTSQSDIIIGSPIAAREQAEIENQIGFYVNTLALRTVFSKEESFNDILVKVKQVCLDAYQHQSYPFDQLVEDLAPVRDMSRSAIFDVMMVLQNNMRNEEISNVSVSDLPVQTAISKFDLTFGFMDVGDRLLLTIDYNTDLYDASRITALTKHFTNLCTQMLAQPDHPIAMLPMLDTDEVQSLLDDFNPVQFQEDHRTLHQLFEAQVVKNPDRIAIAFEERTMTYTELNRKANTLAHWLKQHSQVTPDTLIGIMLERTELMAVGIMGILKSGAGYVPVDPSYPDDRRSYIIRDAGIQILLVDHRIEGIAVPEDCLVVDLSSLSLEVGHSDLNPVSTSTGNNIAYVIYTSGSTGSPKGVVVEHTNAVSLFRHPEFEFDFTEEDIWSVFHSFSFDFSVWEIFGALLSGGKALIVPKSVCLDASLFAQFLHREKVTVLNQTPTFFGELLSSMDAENKVLHTVRNTIFGGEALKPGTLKSVRLRLPQTRLINMYGITETTVHVTYKEIKSSDIERGISNIGKPIASLGIVLVDSDLNMVPAGVVGEILVKGAGVARGYLNRDSLTSEKFITGVSGDATTRYYRSGDMARIMLTGELEFIGRRDSQVKVRGFRIEIGELEHRIVAHEQVDKVIVLAREGGTGDKYLVAYFTARQLVSAQELKDHIRQLLPNYMVPSYLIQMEQFPLTANGKIDTRSLPLVEESEGNNSVSYVGAQNELEAMLVEVWEKVFGRSRLSVLDSFFDVGGDSIKAIQVASRVYQHGYKLTIQKIFQYRTIRDIAINLEKVIAPAEQSPVSGPIPLTPIQQAFFIHPGLSQFYYNQAILLRLSKKFSVEEIKSMMAALVVHHDILRAGFHNTQDKGWTQFNNESGFTYGFEEHNNVVITDLAERMVSIHHKITPLTGPLIRVALFHLPTEDRLFIACHHLVVDGVSWRILLEDIETLLRQVNDKTPFILPLKTTSFKEWAARLSAYASSPELLREQPYWNDIEKHKAAGLSVDFQSEKNAHMDAASIGFVLPAKETNLLLTQVHKPFNTGINDILLVALGLGLHECTGENFFVISMEGHGRENIFPDVDISRTTGWFTTEFPVLLDMTHHQDLGRQIKVMKENMNHIPNKGIGYGILKFLAGETAITSVQKPQIRFNYLGQFDGVTPEHTGFTTVASDVEVPSVSVEGTREFQLEITCMVDENLFHYNVEYNKAVFKTESIDCFTRAIEEALKALISFCVTRQEVELTPADLSFKDISLGELDALKALFEHTPDKLI